VFQSHVVFWGETNTGTEDVFEASALLGESIDNGGVFRNHGCLQPIAENGENAVEALSVSRAINLEADAGSKFTNKEEVKHDGSGKQRIFASVVDSDGVDSTEEDFRDVFVHGTLAITNVGNVLNDDGVVGMFVGLVDDGVGGNHVIDDAGLGNFLGAELLVGGKILAIIVTKMVV